MFNSKNVKEVRPIVPAERVENCELIDIYWVDNNKSPIFSFVHKPTGAKLDHKEFDPDMLDETPENKEKNALMVMSRLIHIAEAFVGRNSKESTMLREIDVSTFKEFVEKVIDIIGNSYMGVECALKVILRGSNNKFYSSLPKVTPFISTEISPEIFSTNPEYDKYSRPDSGSAISPESANNNSKAPQSIF